MDFPPKAKQATARPVRLLPNASRWVSVLAAMVLALAALFQAVADAEASFGEPGAIVAGERGNDAACDDAATSRPDDGCCITSAGCALFPLADATSLVMPDGVREKPEATADAVFDDLTPLQYRPPRFSARA